MNRTALLKRVGNMLWRTPALWVVTLIGVLVETIGSYALHDQSIGAGIIQMVIAFSTAAFTSAALIGLVNLAAQDERASIGAGIESGLRYFPALFIISFILIIPVWIALIAYFLTTGGSIADFILNGLGQPNSLQVPDLLNNLGAMLSIVGVVFAARILTQAIGVGAERAVVIDHQSIWESLKRGAALLRPKIADFIAWGLMLAIAILALQMIVALIFSQLLGVPDLDQKILAAILITLNVITGALTTVLISTVWTLVYREWQTPTPIEDTATDKRVSKKKGQAA